MTVDEAPGMRRNSRIDMIQFVKGFLLPVLSLALGLRLAFACRKGRRLPRPAGRPGVLGAGATEASQEQADAGAASGD